MTPADLLLEYAPAMSTAELAATLRDHVHELALEQRTEFIRETNQRRGPSRAGVRGVVNGDVRPAAPSRRQAQ